MAMSPNSRCYIINTTRQGENKMKHFNPIGAPKMKYYKIILFAICLLCFWALNSYADRLYTWEDKNGVVHISKNPPPNNDELIDTITYKNHPQQPQNRNPPEPNQLKDLNQRDAKNGKKPLEETRTTEDVVKDEDDNGRGTRYTRKVRKEHSQERIEDQKEGRPKKDPPDHRSSSHRK
jgi:hypothetical protein